MTPPQPNEPELLLRKPGTITTAQVFMWLQFAFTLCCGTGGAFVVLFLAGILPEILPGSSSGFQEIAETFTVLIIAVVAAVIGVAVLFAVLANKLGAGRRWAQLTTVVLMLLTIVYGVVSFTTGFEFEEYNGEVPIETSRALSSLLWLAMPAITLICVCTGSANQWFRQGGRDSLRPPQQPPPPPAGPAQPYSPYVGH